MKYLLDTNICIYAIKQKPEAVLQRFLAQDPADLCISAITYAELLHGVEKSRASERNRMALTLFLSPITILPFDDAAAKAYGWVRAGLEQEGTPIGPLDTLIAGHALSADLTLVTNNVREFIRVEGLRVENWV